MPPISVILDQHVEEAALLWLRRDRAVNEPHFDLHDLAALDDQLDAHLDGLRVAETDRCGAAWDVCVRELNRGEDGEVFPAAVLAFECGNETRIQTVLDVASKSAELSRPAISALGWLPHDQAAEHIDRLLAADTPSLRRIGIAASVIHRQDPHSALTAALADSDLDLRARALRAVGELGRFDQLDAARKYIDADDEHCRRSAAWSVALMSETQDATTALMGIVEASALGWPRALQTVLRRMDIDVARAWIGQMAEDNMLCKSAVVGAGIVGVAESVPWLIDQMHVPELARVAGEAFVMITGVDLNDAGLEGDWPEGFEAGPTDDPDDDNTEMDPDENLPWPKAQAIADWWQVNRGLFQSDTRYLLGRPMTLDWLNVVLRQGYQRQREAAALELAILQPGTPLFEIRARGGRQKQQLA